MYTRTPNYMWMLKRLYDSPYSYHWNEWGLKSGVRVLNAHRKRRISTNTIKLNIKREREKESGEKKIGIWSNKRFTDARNSMKCDALLLTEWFSLFYTKRYCNDSNEQQQQQSGKKMFVQKRERRIFTSHIFRDEIEHLASAKVSYDLSSLLTLFSSPSYVAYVCTMWVCGICCANFLRLLVLLFAL